MSLLLQTECHILHTIIFYLYMYAILEGLQSHCCKNMVMDNLLSRVYVLQHKTPNVFHRPSTYAENAKPNYIKFEGFFPIKIA